MTNSQPTRPLIDRNSFERIALHAKVQRANFLRANAGFAFVMAGSIGLACIIALELIPASMTDHQKTSEAVAQMESQSMNRTVLATDQIEKLTAILERATAIGPNEAREIIQLIRQPIYDCNQIACSAELEQRNHLARSKLKSQLARKALPDENATSNDASRQITHLVERLK